MTLLEKQEETIILHFPSLVSMGEVTENLARLNHWDQSYINKIQALYKMDENDTDKWMQIITKYLGQDEENAKDAKYFEELLFQTIQSDKYFQFKIRNAPPSKALQIPKTDFKMLSLATEILNTPNTVFGLERAFTMAVNIEEEQLSSVQDILSQVSAETNPTSRAVSIVNDDIQKDWNLSMTDMQLPEQEDDDDIPLIVCDYYDGEQGRICGAPVIEGQTKCEIHCQPEFNQPMMMINYMKDIEPGRAYHLMESLLVEIPKPNEDTQVAYATNVDGDTGSFLNSMQSLRRMLKTGYEIHCHIKKKIENFDNFNPETLAGVFPEAEYSRAKWFAIYMSLKEKLIHKSLSLDEPWIIHLFKLTNKQGAHQGFISIERQFERDINEEEELNHWPQDYSKSYLDMAIMNAQEKTPHLYMIKNEHSIPPFVNQQTDGHLSQTGQYENGKKHSERSQPMMGIFFNLRPIAYQNPDNNITPDFKALVIIQVEMQVDCQITKPRWGRFIDKLNGVDTDKMEKISVQLQSITLKDGLITKNFNDLDTLARVLQKPDLNQATLDSFLKQLNGSEMTPNGYVGHSTVEKLQRSLQGNKKNHRRAHLNAKERMDIEDMRQVDRRYAAASHFNLKMSSTPKNGLLYAKIAKYLNSNGCDVLFNTSSPYTWSTHFKWWCGGFQTIDPELMTHPALADFRKDFGLDDPNLSKEPMLMEVLGKCYM